MNKNCFFNPNYSFPECLRLGSFSSFILIDFINSWQPFNYFNSNMEELANRNDLEIEELLDEENIVNDIKTNSLKFSKMFPLKFPP